MNTFSIILLGIMVLLIVMVILWVILWVGFDIDIWQIVFIRKHNATGKIKFRQFLILYSVADFPWILDDYTVEYFDRTSGNSFTMYFSILDTFRYILWKCKRERNEAKTKQLNEMKHVLSLMQQDIQEYCNNHVESVKENSNVNQGR